MGHDPRRPGRLAVGAEVLTADGFLARLGDSALRFVETIVAGAVDYGCTLVDGLLTRATPKAP